MSKLIKIAAAAAMLAFGTTTLMAQQAQQKSPADTGSEGTTKSKGATTDPTKSDPAVGTRALGPAKDEKPTDPNAAKLPEVKKMDKETTKE